MDSRLHGSIEKEGCPFSQSHSPAVLFPVILPWSEEGVRAHPCSSSNCSTYSCYSCSFFPVFPFSVMGKSHFLDISDRFESQMMEENSSSISSGFLIIFALLLFPSHLVLKTAQICHCSFFILLFSGFGFPSLLSLMGSTLLPLIFCSSLFSLTRTDPVFVLAFRSFLISFLSFNSLLSSLQI